VRPRRPELAREGIVRAPEQIASVLLNMGAGGGGAGDAATVRRIREAFASHGWACEITPIPAQRFAAEAPLRVRDARGVVVAAGGDGTVNVIANACRAHRRPLGLLPLGRLNLAAHALGLETGIEQAAAAIVDGQPVEVRHGELNGRMFLCSALFGLYPELLRSGRPGPAPGVAGRLSTLAAGLRMLVRSNAPFEAVLEAGVDAGAAAVGDRVRTTTLQVSLDLPSDAVHDPEFAGCIAGGGLVLTGLARYTRWPTLRALLASAFGSIELAHGGIAACASRVVVHSRRKQVPVSMDGDWRTMEPPLEFRVRDSGLQVVRPVAIEARG